MSKTFFTSDTHFGHANIIKYDKRPFDSVEQMNEVLIQNINEKVAKDDVLWHLGDFAFGPTNDNQYMDSLAVLRDKIICKNIYLIWGNHDRRRLWREYETLFASVSDIAEIKVEGQRLVLCHYAMLVWNRSHHGAYHLFGHSHGSLPDNPNSKSFDVGVNCHNYYPISMERVHEIMSKKIHIPVDHHNKETT